MSDKSQLVLRAITNMMALQEGLNGKRLKWFFCFGTLLEWIADGTFNLDYDIDIGCIYGECDSARLAKTLSNYGYELQSVFLHDVDKKPVNLHFVPTRDDIKGTPTVDIFFWLKKGNLYYHTYDTNRECREIPREYTLKGIKEEWINPSIDEINRKRKLYMDNHRIDDNGIWHHDIYGDHSTYKFLAPYSYGTLLDEWYADWRFRRNYKGQSMSQWVETTKSLKGYC